MSEYERGYEMGLEDGHRCEKRHATIDALEKENARLKAQTAPSVDVRTIVGSFAKDFTEYVGLEPVDASELQILAEQLVQAALTQAAPGWTKEKPTRTGLYFYRDAGIKTMGAFVEYFYPANAVDLRVGFTNGWFGSVSSFGGQWSGPIDPPEGDAHG